jgi:hypothetical protein
MTTALHSAHGDSVRTLDTGNGHSVSGAVRVRACKPSGPRCVLHAPGRGVARYAVPVSLGTLGDLTLRRSEVTTLMACPIRSAFNPDVQARAGRVRNRAGGAP